ncbi:lysophospholipid acyltransferase family protein [Roseivirga sp. BDSF3-8]|uniref:lysophospholipid acyltransferase family protein n=1 Tax=Roseivirga sp. BDSF3-8 TaxID=3241598 RepID=UPI003531A802
MKDRILYYGLIVPFSKLPFPVLYFLSDIACFILYRVIGYRKAVIGGNIRRSFPDKSEKEHKAIEKEFYSHFCDLIVESVKTFTISAEESLKRMKVVNAEVVDELFEKGRHITALGGHNGNWELYATACDMQIKHDTVALYTPLSSAFFDKIMRESRSRYGLQMIPTSKNNEMPVGSTKPTMFIFGIDQCPRASQRPYWMEFLNQETGVQYGAEKFARTNDTAVVFGNIKKLKRGYYEVEYQLVCESVSDKPSGWVIEQGTRMLEKKIREQPAYWLWSHKRWKRKREDFDCHKDENVSAPEVTPV